jgi:hypothetical protein
MAELVYLLCALTSALCAALLLRSYFRSRTRLLVWSSLAFVGLALNNVLLFVDLVLLPDTVDLSLLRNFLALAALSLLVFGLIWDAE